MFADQLILNEREAARGRAFVVRAKEVSSGRAAIDAAAAGVSPQVIERHRKAVDTLEQKAAAALRLYEKLKAGVLDESLDRFRRDPGIMLVFARISRGLSQAELADRLGLKEQQIQRYEAERYRSISLSNYRKVANALGVEFTATIRSESFLWSRDVGAEKVPISKSDMSRTLAHAKDNNWISVPDDDDGGAALFAYIKRPERLLASPALLRTGLNPLDITNDLSLSAWRARIVDLAEDRLKSSSKNLPDFDPLEISWLVELARSSANQDGLKTVSQILQDHGIVFLVEPHVAGTRLDGAAIMLRTHPVIAMTLRHDRLDYFWFTLFHELAHVFLHSSSGLAAGFFDDLEAGLTDELEQEANEFAGSLLVPPERWRISPARISKDRDTIIDFAKQIGVHPAIVFGKIRHDRRNYKLFTKEVGAGAVRRQFL
ncbi:XRE family transcriptional regulator [Terrihabitans rhizophilus]|uniref:XRE family transcriptional regulator n=1 Tax=Terrihabitans rhizophilus TaxID=3092662 RepID=A0ABU4RQG8_9HYPH|nr:XRE family transcriptional regulator [Terrihabitans sp. PJ23]MDX6807062.1 XRE family transcriptional regulator [Terrihabitans sp. PJ23]